MKAINFNSVYKRLLAISLLGLIGGPLLKILHVGGMAGTIGMGLGIISLFAMLLIFTYRTFSN